MRPLLLLLCLVGCETDRDLRPELFACDAGGTCSGGGRDGSTPDSSTTDTGISRREINCPAFGNCNCDGDLCVMNCPESSCTPRCTNGADCVVNCSAACEVHCESGSTCNFNCGSGFCQSYCNAGTSCEVQCGAGFCECDGPTCPF